MAAPIEYARTADACVYCGDTADPQLEYVAELTCSFKGCGRQTYHQDCVDNHLRRIKHNPGQMSGFQCPRGHGKMVCESPCGGRVRSTHRFQPCNQKKKNKAVEAAIKAVPAPAAKPVPKPVVATAVKKPLPPPKPQQQDNRPVPVKPPGHPHPSKLKGPAGNNMTQEQLKDAVALIRKQLNSSKTFDTPPAGSSPSPPVTITAPAPSKPTTLASFLSPSTTTLPKPEPVNAAAVVKPQPVPDSRRVVMPPAKKTYSLSADAFPALESAGSGPIISLQPHQTPAMRESRPAVNAINPSDQQSWVTDLDRYNALLALKPSPVDDDPEEYDSITQDIALEASLYNDDVFSGNVTSPTSDFPVISDELVAYAMQYGVEAAGIPPEYHDYFAQIVASYQNWGAGTNFDEANLDGLYQASSALENSLQGMISDGGSYVYEAAGDTTWQQQAQPDYNTVRRAAIDVAQTVQQQQQFGTAVASMSIPGDVLQGEETDDEVDVNELMALCIG